MREMKDSGIEWIGEIPKDWDILRLKYCFSGFTNGTSDTQLSSGESLYPVTRIETISSGEINLDKIGYVAFSKKQYLLKTGDILVSNINSIKYLGNCAVVRDGYRLYHGMNLLRVVPGDYIDNGYAYYLFKSNVFKFPMEKYCKPAINQASVSATTMKNFFIPFPDLVVQQQIADYLDTKCSEIDATAEDIQKEISLLEDYKKSVITEAVTKGLNSDAEMKDSGIEWIGQIPKDWNVVAVKHCFYINNGSDPITDEGEIPVYGSGSKSFKTCKEFKEGPTVLLGRKGTINIPQWIESRYWNVDTAFDVKAKGNYDLKLFYYCAVCFDYERYTTQTALPSMTQGDYKNFKIPYMSFYEQKDIVKFLDTQCSEIDTLIADKKRQLDILAEYKKSLIYEYVTGKKEVV